MKTFNDKIYSLISKNANSDQYSCPECKKLIYNLEIYQCLDGHWCCKDCWAVLLGTKKECPQCECKVESIGLLSRSRYIEKEFLKLMIRCPNSLSMHNLCGDEEFDENGCKDNIALIDLPNHLDQCTYVVVKCPNSENGCLEEFRQNSIESHLQICGYQMETCMKCNDKIIRKSLDLHIHETCLKELVQCDYCDLFEERGLMNHHLNCICPDKIIECILKNEGCCEQFKRSEQANHLLSNDHISRLNKKVDKTLERIDSSDLEISELIQKQNLFSNQLLENGRILNQSRTDLINQKEITKQLISKNNKEKNTWEILNYTKRTFPKDISFSSPKITVGNYEFQLLLFPNGETSPPKKCSLYLVLTKGKKCEISFSVSIKNNEKNNYFSRKFEDLVIDYIKSTTLPNVYNVIGPFPIGEREEIYDTLESYGGIFNIPIGDNTTYPSELGHDSVVGWSTYNWSIPGAFQMEWSSTIDWSFYDMPFGWEIYLWYAYVIGDFTATSPSSNYIVNCTDIRTFYIQSQSNPSEIFEFSGDFFNYGNGQQIIYLNQGEQYRIYLKMLSSTRVYGTAFSQFTCNLIPIEDMVSIIETESLVPDIVSGILASKYASITLLNSGETDLTSGVTIGLVENSTSDQIFELNSILNTSLTNILVGQRFSIPFEISTKDDNISSLQCPLNLEIQILITDQTGTINSFFTSIAFNCTEFTNAYLYTFLDFDQSVQYAMVLSPINQCGLEDGLCNVMVATHGFLGVTRDPSWFAQFQRQQNLWTVMPTGRTNCGYDWASSSRLNVFYSVESLVSSLPGVPNSQKQLYKTDASKILFIGHSMGGMGCWNLLVRQGDLALGGACASGFPKLSMYISYETSPGFSYIDQTLKALLMVSIEENNVDIISSNLVGLKLMARYGENDTVVNPYHSRRIVRMVAEQSQDENAVIVSEVPNENHYFPGILTDSYMQAYYDSLTSIPPIPKTITISTLNPSGTGPRANILILQLTIPFRLAKIKLTQVYDSTGELIWYLDTQNVKRFAITAEPVRAEFPTTLVIDGKQQFNNQYFYPEYHFENSIQQQRTNQKNWTINADNSTWIQNEKNPSTYGPIRQIFESSIKIVYGTASQNNQTIAQAKQAAIYINNFWNNYGRGSVTIFSDQQYIEQLSHQDTSCSENVILIGNSNENLITNKNIIRSDVSFNQDNSFYIGGEDGYLFEGDGIGIAFLMPNRCGGNLMLVISGTDSLGLNNALHSIPQRSGDITGPDFIVTGPDFRGKGYGGIISAGYWDNYYKLSESNFYISEITN
ncbi:hypothetical protein RB653_003576 [Dictyostelium firmibasis]|uniref:TRAF-type domain-containing protein n=1 Tax=Dictyostelium firmibasis TaxID=79012 RepID=A0AAN7U4U4_9MYCE